MAAQQSLESRGPVGPRGARRLRQKRALSLLVSAAMAFELFPAQAIAEALPGEPEEPAVVEQQAEEVAQSQEEVATEEKKQEEVVEAEAEPVAEDAALVAQAEPEEAPALVAQADAEASVNGTSYATLEEAIDKAASGSTITLLTNVERTLSYTSGTQVQTLNVPSGKTLTLNLNGHNIRYVNWNNQVIVNNGNLTIQGDGKVYREDTYTSQTVSSYAPALIDNAVGATLTITGGEYGNSTSTNGILVRNYGTASLSGGRFAGTANNGANTGVTLFVNGANEAGTMSLGGNVQVDVLSGGLLSNVRGDVNISGGTFRGSNVTGAFIYALSNRVRITGGTFNFNASTSVPLFATQYTGDSIVYSNQDKYIVVEGGTFDCDTVATINASVTQSGSTYSSGIAISGGDFYASLPDTVIADGYRLTTTDTSSQRYTVKSGADVVAGVELAGDNDTANIITYYTLARALELASKGSGIGTIWLAENTAENVTVPADLKVTIKTLKDDTSSTALNKYVRYDRTISGTIDVAAGSSTGAGTELTLGGGVTAAGAVAIGGKATLKVGTKGSTTTVTNGATEPEGGDAVVSGTITLKNGATLEVVEGDGSADTYNGHVTGAIVTEDTDALNATFSIVNKGLISGQITGKSGTLNINYDVNKDLINKGRFDLLPKNEGDEDTKVYVYGGLFRDSLVGSDELCPSGYMPATLTNASDIYLNTVKYGVVATIEKNGRLVTNKGTGGYFAVGDKPGGSSTAYTEATALKAAVDNVAAGETLKLQANVSAAANTNALTLDNEATYILDLNGKKIESTYASGIYVAKGDVTIVDSADGALVSTKANVAANGIPYAALVVGYDTNSGKATVEGGTFNGATYAVTVGNASSTLTIPSDSEAEFIGAFKKNGSPTINVKGGFFDAKANGAADSLTSESFISATDWVKETDHVSPIEAYADYSWKTIGAIVASVGTGASAVRYATLQEAIDAAAATTETTDDITLLADVDEPAANVWSGAVVTIDLNGKKLTSVLPVRGVLTIKDGNLTAKPKVANVAGIALGKDGSLTIAQKDSNLRNVWAASVTADPGAGNVATLENTGYVTNVSVSSGTLNVNSATSAKGSEDGAKALGLTTGIFENMPTATSNGTLALMGGLYPSSTTAATIDAACADGYYPVSITDADVHDSTLTNAFKSAYPYAVKKIDNVVATIDNLYYATLQGAVNDAVTGSTITVLGSETTAQSTVFDSATPAADGTVTPTGIRNDKNKKSLIVDLAGVTYNGTLRVRNADVVLTDSKGTGKVIGVNSSSNGAPVVVYGGPNDAEGYGSFKLDSSATVQAVNGYGIQLFANKVGTNASNAGSDTNGFGFDVIVEGTVLGNITVNDHISGSLATRNPMTVVVNDGATVSNTSSSSVLARKNAINMFGYAEVTVGGGSIITSNGSAIEVASGELTVDGGTIVSGLKSFTATKASAADAAQTSGAGITLSQGSSKQQIKAVVNGGTITGWQGLYVGDLQQLTTTADVSLGIHGGTFVSTGAASDSTKKALAIDGTDNATIRSLIKSVDASGKIVTKSDFTPALTSIGVVYDGTFNTELDNADAAPGYVPYELDATNGLWSVRSGKNVAKVLDATLDPAAGKLYTSVQDALDEAAKNTKGGYVLLVEDVTEDVIAKSGKATLVLNGHSLTSATDTVTVNSGATLTITDILSSSKKLSTTSTTASAIVNNGTLTIGGVTVEGGLHTITNNGTLTVKDAVSDANLGQDGAKLSLGTATTVSNSATLNGVDLWSGSDAAKATIQGGAFGTTGVFGKIFDGTAGAISVEYDTANATPKYTGGTYSDDFSATAAMPSENVDLTITTGYAPVENTGTGNKAYKIAQSIKAYDFVRTIYYVAGDILGASTKIADIATFTAMDHWTGKEIGPVSSLTAAGKPLNGIIWTNSKFFVPQKDELTGLTPNMNGNYPVGAGTYLRSVTLGSSTTDAELVILPYDISESAEFLADFKAVYGNTAGVARLSAANAAANVTVKVGSNNAVAGVFFDPFATDGIVLPVTDEGANPAIVTQAMTFRSGAETVAAANAGTAVNLIEQLDLDSVVAGQTVGNVSGVYVKGYAENTSVNKSASVTVVGQGNFTGERTINYEIKAIPVTNANKAATDAMKASLPNGEQHVMAALDLTAKGGQVKPVVWYAKDKVSSDVTTLNGAPITLDVIAPAEGDVQLIESKDYSLGYSSINGTNTVTVTGLGNYSGQFALNYKDTDVLATDIETDPAVRIYLSDAPVSVVTDASGYASADAVASALAAAKATLVWNGEKKDTYQFVSNGSEFKPALTVVVDLADGGSRVYSYNPNQTTNTLFDTYFAATPTAGRDVQAGIPYALGTNGRDYSGNVSLAWDVVAEKEPTKIAKPTATSYDYDGTEKVGVPAGDAYVLSGTPSATAVGSYAVTVTLKDKEGTCWSDGTTGDLTLAWAIRDASKPLDRSALEDEILYAAFLPLDATVSASGKDVSPADEYVTKADVNALRKAVTDARAAGRRATTQGEVDQALAGLQAAERAFADAAKPGKATPEFFASKAHIQTYGDREFSADRRTGVLAMGTTGESKRVENMTIGIDATERGVTGGVKAGAHVQGIGDKDGTINSDGSVTVGTSGQSRRMEAFWLSLTGDLATYYDVYYRAHIQTHGWLGWAKNGERCGSEGGSRRMESLEIVVLPKGEVPAGYDAGVDAYLVLNKDGSKQA